jgi:hypothetical protein
LSESPGAGERNPARFSYSQDLRKGTTGAQFDTDFYLNWDLDPRGIPTEFFLSNQSLITNALSLSAQGKLSSTDTQSTDAWRFRFEDQLVDIFPKGSFVLNASVKEESDRDFHLERVGTEIWTTITDTSLFHRRRTYQKLDCTPMASLSRGGYRRIPKQQHASRRR